MEESMTRILKVTPQEAPYEKKIYNTLAGCQGEVRGNIEVLPLSNGCLIVANDESKINGMKPNRRYGNDIICGLFFICGEGEDGDFISLTDEQIKRYTEQFSEIEQFQGNEPVLEPRIDVAVWDDFHM